MVEDSSTTDSTTSVDEAARDFVEAYAINNAGQPYDRYWFLDSGATQHVTCNRNTNKNLEDSKESMQFGRPADKLAT